MKLTVLDGGSARSAFLVKPLTYNAHRIGLTKVAFLDNSTDNLAISGEIARYVFNIIHPDIQFNITTDPVTALQDASYIITILWADGDGSRTCDERIVLQYNTLDQGTTGTSGFAMVTRSIPVILHYCRLIEERTTEDTTLFNFTNPSSLMTEAIVKSGFKRRVYGIRDAPSELIRELPTILGYEECSLSVKYYGPNRFSWFTHFTVHGEGVAEWLIVNPELYQGTAMQYFSPEPMQLCDNQLLDEHLYYCYYREVVLEAIREADKTHGEQITRINQEMHEVLRIVDARMQPEAAFAIQMRHYLHRGNNYMQSKSRQERFHVREPLTLRRFIEEPDTGGYAGVVLDVLETMNNITTKRAVVPIQNHDTLDLLRPDDVVEISCDLSQDGLKPVTSVKVSTAQKNMISCMKEYKRLVVVAILQQDKLLTMRALIAHSLIGSYSLVKTLVETYLDDKQLAAWQQSILPVGFLPLVLRLAGLQAGRFVFDVSRVRRKPPPDKIVASPGNPGKAPITIWELPRSRHVQQDYERSGLCFMQVGSGVGHHPAK